MLSKSPVPGSQIYIFEGTADPRCDGLATGLVVCLHIVYCNVKNLWIENIV